MDKLTFDRTFSLPTFVMMHACMHFLGRMEMTSNWFPSKVTTWSQPTTELRILLYRHVLYAVMSNAMQTAELY